MIASFHVHREHPVVWWAQNRLVFNWLAARLVRVWPDIRYVDSFRFPPFRYASGRGVNRSFSLRSTCTTFAL